MIAIRNAIHSAMLAGCLLTLSGCNPDQPSVPPATPLDIGMLVDFGSTGGPPSLNAARLFIKQKNEAGGLVVDGQMRLLELHVLDTQLSPDQSMAAARELIYEKNVAAIIGPNYSSNVLAAGTIAESAGVVLISPGATLPQSSQGRQFVFRVAYDDPTQGRVLADFAAGHLGVTRIAALFDVSNPSSRAVTEALRDRFAEHADTTFESISYVADEVGFEAMLDRLLANSPDAIVLPNPTRETLAQARYLESRSFDGIVLGSDNWGPDAVGQEPALEGAFYTHHWSMQDASSEHVAAAEFRTAYLTQFHSLPSPMAALTYDALSILAEAMEIGGVQGEHLVHALRQLPERERLTGRFDQSTADHSSKQPLLLRIVNGQSRRYTL